MGTKIICIAIRRLPERLESSEFPLAESGRIEYYPGDLALPRFGLTGAQQSDIFNQVDVVIHNGADTSHMKPYIALRDTNVESTRCLIQLCVERHIPLHYISSAGIAILSKLRPFPSVRVSGHIKDLSADGSMGYACSKWVCERMLEGTNTHYGLPIWIHRPSTIIRQGHDAETQRASFDWVNIFLEYSHKIQAVPQIVNNQGALDLVHVQTCCNDIIAEVKSNKPRLASGMTYQNNVGDVVIPIGGLSEIALEKGHLKPYQILPWEE